MKLSIPLQELQPSWQLFDPQTQVATMMIATDPYFPVLETGIYNLTQSELPARVNFADGRTGSMLPVCLNEPNG